MTKLCLLILLGPAILAAQNERVIVKIAAPDGREQVLAKPLLRQLVAIPGIEVTADELNNEVEIILDVKVVGTSPETQLFVVQTLVRSREVSYQLTARLMTSGAYKSMPGSLKAVRDVWWVPILRHEVVRPEKWDEYISSFVGEFARVIALSPVAREAVR